MSYFFCEQDKTESLRARTILGCIIRQQMSLESLSEALEAQLAEIHSDDRFDAARLEPLLTAVTKSCHKYYFIIDGLDECSPAERDKLLKTVQRHLSSSKVTIKLFFATRENFAQDIKANFPDYVHRTMSGPGVDADIKTYIVEVIKERIRQGTLTIQDPKLLLEIVETLVQKANGM